MMELILKDAVIQQHSLHMKKLQLIEGDWTKLDLALKIIGIVFILRGLEGFFSFFKEMRKNKNDFAGRDVSTLTNGYILLTGCFLFSIPFLRIKLEQLYLLGAFYALFSTVFWIFIHHLEKEKQV
jgi:hypothetical protein